MTVRNAICAKWGTAYGPEYVNRLKNAARRNLRTDLRFFCLTDDATGLDPDVEVLPLVPEPFQERFDAARAKQKKQGALRKISAFRPDLVPDLEGPMILFDLDVVIVGNLDDLFDYEPGKVCMRSVWATPTPAIGVGQGSVIRFDPKLHGYLYENMARDPESEVARCHGSEQAYTSWTAHRAGDFAPFPGEWIASFKYDCRPPRPLNLVLRPRLPEGARVVCFHGNPKMSAAIDGYRSDPLHSTRASDWMKENWLGPEG